MKTRLTVAGRGFLLYLFTALGVLLMSPLLSVQAGKPTRIVSINLSADQLLLQLVDRERIVALSRLAVDPEISQLADQASGIPTTKGTAEEVLRLRPDLVLAGRFTNQSTTGLLRKLGIQVLELPHPADFEEIRELILNVSEALGERRRGEVLIEEMDRRLEALRRQVERRGGERPSVLSYGQNGYTQGVYSLMDTILDEAGLRNAAGGFGLEFSGDLALEELLLAPPDFLVFSPYREQHATLGGQWLNHRALRQVRKRLQIIEISMAEVICGNNLTVGASEKLWRASQRLANEGKE